MMRDAAGDQRLLGVAQAGAEAFALAAVGLRVAVVRGARWVAAGGGADEIEVELALRGDRGGLSVCG